MAQGARAVTALSTSCLLLITLSMLTALYAVYTFLIQVVRHSIICRLLSTGFRRYTTFMSFLGSVIPKRAVTAPVMGVPRYAVAGQKAIARIHGRAGMGCLNNKSLTVFLSSASSMLAICKTLFALNTPLSLRLISAGEAIDKAKCVK
ncbi:hypothetical protein B0H10DRAFT_2030443 [Mycena sp. CBHHK59/15]|nr:hypothetical protein B0H10DRAFT_2030443 [Mycena sp. CBHHK59/15]